MQGPDEVRVVALLGEVQEDNVVAGGDAADGLGGFLVGEVAAAAHDALLEEVGAVGIDLELRAVVGLDGEDIDPAKVGDEMVGDLAEVGGVAESAGWGVEAERRGPERIVELHERIDGEPGGGEESVAEGRDPAGREALAAGAAEVTAGEEDFNVGRQRAIGDAPPGVAVVVVEVGEEYGVDVGEIEPEPLEQGRRAAGGEAEVEEGERGAAGGA